MGVSSENEWQFPDGGEDDGCALRLGLDVVQVGERRGVDRSITTGGGVSSCPIAAEIECISNINAPNFDPAKLINSERVGEPCVSCNIFEECGGRCLYANQTKWWGEEGFLEVCKTIRHLMKEIHRIQPTAQQQIDEGVFTVEDFHYPPYNNSIETIPWRVCLSIRHRIVCFFCSLCCVFNTHTVE